MSASAANAIRAAEAGELSLMIAALLLVNGAETRQIYKSLTDAGSALGYEVNIIITLETLIVHTEVDGVAAIRIGHHLPAPIVNMTLIDCVNQAIETIKNDPSEWRSVICRLEKLQNIKALYSANVIAVGIGMSAASLSHIFGGDWYIFSIVFIAATVGTLVRQRFVQLGLNGLVVPFLAALSSGIVGGIGIHIHHSYNDYLSLVAPAMLLVPGVPLINGIRDALGNNIHLAESRLTFFTCVTGSIALGLFVATWITGVRIPVVGSMTLLPLLEDALFTAITTVGFVFLFNVGYRVAWGCIICGLCGHTLRNALMHVGLDMVCATLVASSVSGTMAQLFARQYATPASTFAFPAVLAMVPGVFAFRFVIGFLQITHLQGHASAELQAETLAALGTTALLALAISVGLAIPLFFSVKPHPHGFRPIFSPQAKCHGRSVDAA
ncbi:uncharacterized membrane protein YjjP (DUF1212 family) [Silvibacterium bohemicum]|uniref:Uncharacterized membrane protein YjjP (DUF1212 family) n=1 Tax=Silvibacterium bohemicum TaxID=1577686 RepID=A0A841K1A2_9BACT|nr:threonine/serine exporter family protein [Silvibacterium bohemicum]MBB6146765.1 uncharacterized membrane protein YjjP (DUF1212 family) [Silvibacterium bohemicum]